MRKVNILRFIISFQTKKRTFVIGHGEKQHNYFLSMIMSIMHKSLQLGISKDELHNCITIAEDMIKEKTVLNTKKDI